MRTLLRAALIAALCLTTALPATATQSSGGSADAGDDVGDNAVEVLPECGGNVPVVTLDDLSEPIETPMLPSDATTTYYRLSLAGNPVDDDRASVNVEISWDDPVSDFELRANGQSSVQINAIAGASERISLGTLKHCDAIAVTVENFAGSPVATITLDLDVR